jgi:hypothetical protein
MASKWYKNFKYAMGGVGMPVPESLFTTCATATGTIAALVKALQLQAGANSSTMTIRTLVLAAENSGLDLTTTLGASFAGELLVYAGAVSASAYIGALVGAAIAATASSGLDWFDSVFSHDDATQNFQQIADTASNYTNVPTLSGPVTAATPVCSDSSDAGSSGDDSSNPAQQVCQVPAASCNGDGIGDTSYCAGWPTKPNY